ncbi:MAG: transglutaminase domain-containing protein [Leptospiraceae bacterium]|nr:transglutaminase domain-containing protein [Leptospiraceae bacterium]
MMNDLSIYLAPSYYMDFESEPIQDYVRSELAGLSQKEAAIKAYYFVRDHFRYNPYKVGFTPEEYRSSYIMTQKQSFCIPKSVLYCSLMRAVGIPSRLGLADVINHLSSEEFIKKLGSEIFAFHGFAEIYLDGWIKATPVFDSRLCKKFGVAPLDFDAEHDAMFQSFDDHGNQFMEYVKDRGVHADLPFDTIMEGFREFYPNFLTSGKKDGDLMEETVPKAT